MTQAQEIKKEFINILPLSLANKLKLKVGFDNAIAPDLTQEFLLDGDLVDFPTFIVELKKRFTPQNMQPNTNILITKMIPNEILKSDGVDITEVTAFLDKNGLPAGYIETITAEGKRLSDYSQHFGFLDDHSFFYEDSVPEHRNDGIIKYFDLKEMSGAFTFTRQHEAYRRVIQPAIGRIEAQIAENAISHAPIVSDAEKLNEM